MTLCEKLGYKVGDEFEYAGAVEFDTGDMIVLIDDDGSDQPDFRRKSDSLEQYCFLDDVRPHRITLQKGDYCSTDNMTEETYHAVAAAFMAAGCDADMHGHLDYGKVPSQPYLEWYRTDLCSTTKPEPHGRHLTPAQIIGAVNAKTTEQEQTGMHPIDNLHTKRQARNVAEQQYQAALAEVREVYPWIRVEEKDEQPAEDLSDPANWRAGDVLKCVRSEYENVYTVGKEYKLKGVTRSGWLDVADNFGGESSCHVKISGGSVGFNFIRRP